MLGATIKNDPGVMILENSISSKSQGKYKKTDPSKTSPIHYPKKDELNNWEYCNPSNFEDQLPQPYRFINRCLNEMLLNNVYEQVFEIEKYKSNVNYEGLVKEIVSSGTFEIEGVSCLASSFENPTNHLFAGDYYGNIFLLDLNKKIQTAKISVSPGKRVISISANTLKDDDSITTLCVICRGDPMLHVYRYKAGESKLFKNFTICLLKKNEILDKNTPLSLFPYACKISSESKFVILVLYNGNIEIFLLPEPQQALQSNSQSQSDFKLGPKQPSKPVDIINKPSQQPPMIILDTAITEITEPFYSITAKIPLKKKTYEETLNSFIQSVEKKNVDEPIDPKLLTKDNKKIAVPPPDPKKPSPNALKQEAPTIINSEYAQLLGDIIKNDKDADISPNYEVFRNRAEVFFISEKLCVPNDIKTFSKIKEFDVITGIAIVWMGQKFVDFHRIQSLSKENIPTYIQQRINPTTIITEEKSIKQELQMTAAKVDTLKKPTTPNPPQNTNSKPNEIKNQQYVTFEKKITKSFDVLYDISIATVNKSNTFLALGLIDGSVFIYDILLCQEHCYLDKHVSEVTHIKFFEDWTVVSGSADGVVHIYNLKESRLEMKRTNIFMSNNLEIRGLEISEQGLALVIDNQFNARVYDIVHHEKIMRLLPVSIMDQIKKQWCLWPNPIISAQKDQFCLVVNQINPNSDPDLLTSNSFQKNGKVLIYRIFENLLTIFPALSNLYRKGISKEKLRNAFQRMNFDELKNPQFEIPIIASNLDPKGPKTLSIIQTRQNLKSLPVIEENPKKSMKFQINSMKMNSSIQNQKISPDAKSNLSFSKIQTKESEVASSVDLNSSFKSLPPNNLLGKGNKGKKVEKAEGLTKDALHPENILHESRKLAAPELFHPLKDPVKRTINFTKDKMLRIEKMDKTFSRINNELETQEAKKNLRKKKELLKKTMN